MTTDISSNSNNSSNSSDSNNSSDRNISSDSSNSSNNSNSSNCNKIVNLINLDVLEDLDIILFTGQDYWASYLIEYFTWSNYSHIGIVLRSPTYISPELTGTYLLESGTEDFPDSEDHKMKFGVRLSDLNKVISEYTGRIYYRKCTHPFNINEISRQALHDKIKKIHNTIYDKPYDDYLVDLLRTEFHFKIGNCQDSKEFFCSALAAYVYTQLGFLPANTQWSLILPKYFGQGNKIDQMLQEEHQASLGKLIKIK